MKNKIKYSAALVAMTGFLFSGCTLSYSTSVIPSALDENTVTIKANQDATGLGFLGSGDVLEENYKYSFAIAATATKKAGFKYFSITAPNAFREQLIGRNVKNVEGAYEACTEGDGSFSTALTFSRNSELNGVKYSSNLCDYIEKAVVSNTFKKGTTTYMPVSYTIIMHNEDLKDHVTFNAQEILDSELIKDLNPEYFVPMTR